MGFKCGIMLLGILFLSSAAIAGSDSNQRPSASSKNEAAELVKSKNLATRDGNKLTLLLNSGKAMVLTDGDCATPEHCAVYKYRGLLAGNQFFIIEENFYENGTIMLVSRKAGSQYDVIDYPHLSPNRKFILSASESEVSKSGVFLWEIQDGTLIDRFHFEPSDYELFRFSHWTGSSSAELIETTHSKDCPKNQDIIEIPVRLVEKNSGWELENISKGKCRD